MCPAPIVVVATACALGKICNARDMLHIFLRPAGADLAKGTIWPRRARVTLWSSVGENYAKMNEGEIGRLRRLG